MAERAWKACERAVAKRLGGQRIPVSGRAGQPDIAHPTLAIEVKHRKTLPAWLLDAMRQAEAAAKPGQVAVVILHQAGDAYDSALCVLRLADFARLAQGGGGSKSLGPHRP